MSSRLWKAVLLSKGFATPQRLVVPPSRLTGRSRVPAAQEVGGAQASARDQQYAYLRGNEVPVEHARDLEAQALLFGAMEDHIDWAGNVAWLTDGVTSCLTEKRTLARRNRRTKACVPVICLSRSGWSWAGGYADMPTRSWPDKQNRSILTAPQGHGVRQATGLRPSWPRSPMADAAADGAGRP